MLPMLPTRRGLMVLLMSLALAACSTPTESGEPTRSEPAGEPSQPSATSSPAASAVASTPDPDPSSPPPVAGDPPGLALDEIASGLNAPTNITTTPDGWLLVNERPGRVIAVDPASGETAVVLDISDRVIGEGERGLLGLALHPDWPQEERAFIHYSAREGDGDTVVSEFTGSADGPPTLDAGSERMLFRVDQPYANHNGGQLAFGPDGYLWIGLGDGGSGGDPEGNGQDPATLLGSILRLNVDDIPDDGNDAIGYGIPDDNPFADGDGGAPEVYLYGLRNPWRFSFDRETDALWIADVGQNELEEINRLDPVADAGANLGWNIMEATSCFADDGCSTEGLVLPITEYGRDLGCSVTGGYVYRGNAIDGLRGWYLFGDYCEGSVFGIPSDAEPPADGETVEPRLLLESGASVSSFGEGADGELYLADLSSGTIYRIVEGG
ncbi:PQQ-dependent sugar dehydrogenase [soil metagenome]